MTNEYGLLFNYFTNKLNNSCIKNSIPLIFSTKISHVLLAMSLFGNRKSLEVHKQSAAHTSKKAGS